jgi:hypothetical protein
MDLLTPRLRCYEDDAVRECLKKQQIRVSGVVELHGKKFLI